MGHEHDRLLHLRLQLQQLLLKPSAHDRIDGPERLVHQENGRIGGERPRHTNALLLTSRELGRVATEHLGFEAHELDQLIHPRFDSSGVPAEQLGNGADVLGDGAVGEQTDLLDHVPDRTPQQMRLHGGGLATVDPDPPRRRFDDAVDHLEGGRLATTGGPDQGQDRSSGDLEAQIADGGGVRARERLRDVLQGDHGVRHAANLAPTTGTLPGSADEF